jgi:23S rRNA (uracil1939-C5)-methyltransferase
MLSAGQIVSLSIEKPAAGGRMIARVDGQVVLVAGAIPGERVEARIERVSKGLAFADTLRVTEPSPDRRAPFADPLCGGDLFGHITYPRQLEIKRQIIADALARIGHFAWSAPIQVTGSPEEGYRMRARLHVCGTRIGFFREGTHEVCDARQTRQLLPATCDTLDRLAAAIRSVGPDAVREIELAENVEASERVVHIETTRPLDVRVVEKLTSVDDLTPGPYVTDTLVFNGKPVTLRRHVLAFFQGNRHLLQPFVAHVVDRIPSSDEVVDLYAGVGLFAICTAASRGVRVTAVEGDRVAAADLVANATAASASGHAASAEPAAAHSAAPDSAAAHTARADATGAHTAAAVIPVHQPVEAFLAEAKGGERGRTTVIVDPPRTGMSRDALDGIIRFAPSRVVYVSCDAPTLARDARRLVDAAYEVERIDAFDLFPNTPHVETVVVFRRE